MTDARWLAVAKQNVIARRLSVSDMHLLAKLNLRASVDATYLLANEPTANEATERQWERDSGKQHLAAIINVNQSRYYLHS